MNNSSDNLSWDDPEDTLPPIPDVPEHYGPDIHRKAGTFVSPERLAKRGLMRTASK